ncbi:MAG: RNA polymerase sigma factor [Opitutaceae bacterium]
MSKNPAHEALLKEWLESHRGIIFKVTLSFARTATEVADLQQEIQLQLWNSLSAFSGKAKASTWIYRVSLNTALAWRRGTDRRTGKIEPDASLSQIVDQAASPADRASQHEVLGQLYAAIHRMDDADRALILLLLDGLAYREIAEITGLTEIHVGVALTRARKRLTTLMKGVIDELE